MQEYWEKNQMGEKIGFNLNGWKRKKKTKINVIKDGEEQKEGDDDKDEGERLSIQTNETDGANHQPLFISSRTCRSCSVQLTQKQQMSF